MFLYIILSIFIIFIIFIYFTIGFKILIFLLNFPKHSFKKKNPVKSLDYSKSSSWELFGTNSKLDFGVDVFFIHPTVYFRGDYWNGRLKEESSSSHNRKWVIKNMASVFDDFSIYVPKYREATIYAFFNMKNENSQLALELAYNDIKSAFKEFISKNKNKPFILAGHSQGSFHGVRLLKEIEQTPDIKNLVVAYFPGGLKKSMVQGLKTSLSSNKKEINCYVSWSTYGKNYKPKKDEIIDPFICVNPVSWEINGSSNKENHLGMVPEVGVLNFKILGKDKVPNFNFPKLSQAIEKYTKTFCENGLLKIDIKDPENYNVFNKDDYHNYDYSLFHMDIKENAKLRVKEYFKKKP